MNNWLLMFTLFCSGFALGSSVTVLIFNYYKGNRPDRWDE